MLCLFLVAGVRAQNATPPDKEKEPAQEKERQRPADVRELFATFASMPGLEATYTEKKHLTLLAVPLESRGKLYFLPPGYLARVIEAPEKSTLIITPRELRMTGRDGVEVVDLAQSDRVRLFVTSLVRVFGGDRDTLERDYTIEYAPSKTDATTWRLQLTPRDKPLTQMLKALTLHGDGNAVTRIEVVEPNDDRTVTTIVAADPKRTFTKEEKVKLFGAEDEGPSGSAKKAR